MYISEREHICKFIDYILCKLHSLRIGNIDHITRHTLPQPNLVLVFGVAREELRIRSNGRLRMSGYINFGNYLNKTLLCIFYNLFYIFTGIETTIAYSIRLYISPCADLAVAPSANLGQLRVFLYLDAPALVLGQVPMEAVHLVSSHNIKNLLYLLLAVEVTALVEHKSTPAETRLIENRHCRNAPLLYTLIGYSCHNIAWHKLFECLESIEETGRCCRCNVYSFRSN